VPKKGLGFGNLNNFKYIFPAAPALTGITSNFPIPKPPIKSKSASPIPQHALNELLILVFMQFCRCQDLLNRSSMICISRLWISSLSASILSKCSFRSTPCSWITGISPSFRRMPWLESSASVIWRMSCPSSSRLRRRASLKSLGLYLSLSLFGLFLPLRGTCLRLRIHSTPLSCVWVRCTGWCTCRRRTVRRVLWRPRR